MAAATSPTQGMGMPLPNNPGLPPAVPPVPGTGTLLAAPGMASQGLAAQAAASPLLNRDSAQALQAARAPMIPAGGMPVAGGQSDASTGGANRQAAAVTSIGGRLPFTPEQAARVMFGDASINAAQRANAAPTMAGALGGGLRAAGDAAVHAIVTPPALAFNGVRTIGSAIGDFASGVASGFTGGQPVAAVTPAAAAPAVASAPAPAAAPYTAPVPTAGPRPGVAQIITPTAGGYTRTLYATGGDAPATAGMPAPAPREQMALEKAAGVPAGYVQDYMDRVPLGQRLAVVKQLGEAEQSAVQQQLRTEQLKQVVSDRTASRVRAPGMSDAAYQKQVAEGDEAFRRQAALIFSPQAVTAGLPVGAYATQN